MDPLSGLERLYEDYVALFRDGRGELPEMMELKLRHTREVVRNSVLIAGGERFGALETFTARAAALLHDTGRYAQLKEYGTFRDSDSVDHAVFSHDIVKAEGWLATLDLSMFPSGDVEASGGPSGVADAILSAVLWHNRRELPPRDPSSPRDLAYLAAHTVRDADKLDIFRVLEERVKTTDWHKERTAFWNLSPDGKPAREVIDAIKSGSSIDYGSIRSLSDFILIQVGWMVSGLHFPVSRRICRERGHLAFRRDFLRSLSGDSSADEVCDLAGRALERS